MATVIWDQAVGNGWGTKQNWDTGDIPADGDDVIFNGTSTADCNVDEDTAAIATLTITSAYTGTITIQATYTVTVTGAFSVDGGTFDANAQALDVGTFNVGSNITLFDAGGAATITVSGNLTVADVASIADFTGSTVTIDATGNISNPRATNHFQNLTLSGAITTTITGNFQVDGTFTTGGATSTIQDDGTNRTIFLENGMVNNGPTWNSTAGGRLEIEWAGGGAITIPSDDYGDVAMEVRDSGTIATLGGNVTCYDMLLADGSEVRCSSYTLTLTVTGAVGLQVGGTSPGLDGCTFDVQSGVVDIAGHLALMGGNTTANTLDGGSGTILLNGDWQYDDDDTVNPVFTKGTSTVDMDGTGSIDQGPSGNGFYVLKVGASTKTTTLTTNVTADRLVIGAGTLALVTFQMSVANGAAAGLILDTDPSSTITRTSSSGEIYLWVPATGTSTADGFNATINLSIFGGAGTLQMLSALTCDGFWYWQTGTFDMNDVVLTCTGLQANTGTMLFGSATHDINGDVNTFDNGGTLNLEGATLQVQGNWDTGTCTIAGGTSTVQFDGSGAQSFDSNGETFNIVQITKGGDTLTLTAALTCTGAFRTDTGTVDTGSYAVSCQDFLHFNGTLNAGTTTFTCSRHCRRTGGDISGANAIWDLTGTGNLENDSIAYPFGTVKCAAATKTTTLIDTCVTKKWEFGTGVITATGVWDIKTYFSPAGKILTNAGVTVNASGGGNPRLRIQYVAGGAGVTMDGINMGSGQIIVEPGTNSYFDLLGNWTTTGNFQYTQASNGSNFDLNGHNLTCGALTVGSGSSSNTCVFYCGEGQVDCTSFDTPSGAGVVTLALETCSFFCGGSFTIGHANHVITTGASTVRFDATTPGPHTIDLNGESLAAVEVDGSGTTYQLGSALTCTGNFTVGSSTLFNTGADYALTVGGQFVFQAGAPASVDFNNSTVNITGAMQLALGPVDLGGATISVGGNVTIDPTTTLTKGTSKFILNGTGNQNFQSGGKQIHDLDNNNTSATVSFTDAVDIAGTFDPAPGSTTKFDQTGAHSIYAWELTGSLGNIITLRSELDTDQWDVTLTVAAVAMYVDVQDSNLSGANVDATDASNVDSGNNSANWIFTQVFDEDYEDESLSPSIEVGT